MRVAIYAKGLEIEIEPPPGGLLSAKFHTINPLGTIPCLMLEGEVPLPESAAILEYLEDKFPDPPLRPAHAEGRAHVRLLQRIGELQITTPLVELARLDGRATSDPTFATWLTRLIRGLSSLQIYLKEEGFAAGPQLTLADCQLAPALFLLPKVAGQIGKPNLLSAYPSLMRYFDSVTKHTAVQKVLDEMTPAWSGQAKAA
ncbi:MAG: glutathione S-transferase N-terminal domain-containing protein [Methylobacteriaceae bacterium]|nr:glutathione S-transferase N-terminal domain-containing protein [Methylobacteriaceae bacterium]